MDNKEIAKQLSEQHWPRLVIKNTVCGACNFQNAANELAEIVYITIKNSEIDQDTRSETIQNPV